MAYRSNNYASIAFLRQMHPFMIAPKVILLVQFQKPALQGSVTAAPSSRTVAGRPYIFLRHFICRSRRKDNHHHASTSPSSRPIATPHRSSDAPLPLATPHRSPLAPQDSLSVAMQPLSGPHLRCAINYSDPWRLLYSSQQPPRVPLLFTQRRPRRRRRLPCGSSSLPPIWF
ncbi:uncharacterized protein LOC127747536 isoform X1 [Arachis duranensis]|uniref:Uncharacterized protein LOC127747536 isoform X1 n=1 Tax=Arachis duranensis TaxID=130453 RepID=A0A9C6WTF6_ARADU|nr:uncharacterized protein LOC127747536 isoform X1 [Arachis duranensis]